ncbi:MAG: hypothetical protein P4L55_20525 [Syntrophobacteraceae bacterium]|nr:hypothetical protein [Syntrophobacteraceae bacterium]
MRDPKPEQQGSQDGACGFYALGNALAIVCPKVRRNIDAIFKEIYDFYLKDHDGSHFLAGMGRNMLNDLASHVLTHISKYYDQDVSVKHPFWARRANTLGEWRKTLNAHFQDNPDGAAIIAYEYCKDAVEAESHWTVIKKMTSTSIFTFDSSNERKYIPFRLCRIWDDKSKNKARPYKIDTTSTFLFYRNVYEAHQ